VLDSFNALDRGEILPSFAMPQIPTGAHAALIPPLKVTMLTLCVCDFADGESLMW